MDAVEKEQSLEDATSGISNEIIRDAYCKIKLDAKNGKANKKLIDDGSYFRVIKIAKNSRVRRLKNVVGPHLFVKSLASPVTRWVALHRDPDYTVSDSGF